MLKALTIIALMAGTCFAESAEPSKFYKLDFVVKEVEGGKVVNAHAYSLLASTNGSSSLRTGSRVPAPAVPGNTAFTFVDIGTDIDCSSINEIQQRDLALHIGADIKSTVHDPASPDYPVIRQNKWSSNIVVPLKKATIVFSSDDATTKRQLQLELTATPVGN